MANTLALRRRIHTAQNISKTTRAMQMIAASRLKRAQQAVLSSRPYVNELIMLTKGLSQDSGVKDAHPYLDNKVHGEKTLYIIISPDRGLCGGLVTNLIREYLRYKVDSSYFVAVGKKIESSIASTSKNLIASFSAGNTLPTFDMVLPLREIIDDYFLGGKVREVKLIATHFVSVFSQIPNVTSLLPVELDDLKNEEMLTTNFSSRLFEPKKEIILPALLKRYVEMTIYQHLVESYASFQAAQMIAMQNATNNAKDIVSALRLLYNKARQEKITNEILDISSAVAASSNE